MCLGSWAADSALRGGFRVLGFHNEASCGAEKVILIDNQDYRLHFAKDHIKGPIDTINFDHVKVGHLVPAAGPMALPSVLPSERLPGACWPPCYDT